MSKCPKGVKQNYKRTKGKHCSKVHEELEHRVRISIYSLKKKEHVSIKTMMAQQFFFSR
jgi:hypothetical protein